MNRKGILLVNPYIEDFAAYDHFSKPLGLLTLAPYLKEHFDVYFINAMSRVHPGVKGMRFREGGTGRFPYRFIETPSILGDIPRRFKRYGIGEEAFCSCLEDVPFIPEYIFITTAMTYWYTGTAYTAGILKKFFPGSKIVLGGIYPTLLPGHAMKNIGCDYVVRGREITDVLSSIEKITGLEFNKELKAPSYELSEEYYYSPVMTSTGCVFNCPYCAGSYRNPFRQYPVSMVTDMITELHKKYGVGNIAFYDDALLACSNSHLDVILENIIKKGLKIRFYTPNGLHIRFLTLRTAMLMKQAGFADVRLSLESADDEFQNMQGNKSSRSEFARAMEYLEEAGFRRSEIKCYVLVNIPGQDPYSIEKTMETAYGCGALPMLAYYSPIPHTPDFDKASAVTDVSEPLFQNNSVYLYRSGFDMEYLRYLKGMELSYREKAE